MRRLSLASLCLGLALLVSSHVQAVTPDEMLADPALEARARSLSEGLRCLVCQNQSIDASDADLARDLRILVRERITAGDTDDEVTDYIVSRYGEFVLLKPRFDLSNALLWGAPFLLLIGGAVFVFRASRKKQPAEAAELSKEEQAALDQMLGRDQ
ncbi:cytochrome C [Mesorhizobium sp. Root157]|nr:cytochrome C [Mesorhizobium sp. Root157]